MCKAGHMSDLVGIVLDKTTYKGLRSENWSERKVAQFEEKYTAWERARTAIASRRTILSPIKAQCLHVFTGQFWL